ncbi:MAG: hemolysin family protein [Lachnospiraceae bacterium]
MDPDADTVNMAGQLILLVVLTLVNAFFAGAEMAVVSVNKSKIKKLAEEGNKKALKIEQLSGDFTRFLSTIQVAITFAGFFTSASAATGISTVFGAWLVNAGIPFGQTLSFVLITIILSYFNLVFGELVPKRIALQKAETFSMFVVGPIFFISKLLAPFIALLSVSTKVVLRAIGMRDDNLEEKVSEEEIRALLQTGSESGVFNEIETEMINSIFSFDDKIAREIMVPRKDIYAVDAEEPLMEYLDELLESKHSRVPVYEGDIDHIIGILNLKDIVAEARRSSFEDIEIRSIMHEPYFVHSTKNADELFQVLKKEHQHMAILIDEYGGTAGLVTIEDLIEEIVGELNDEYDTEEEIEIQPLGDDTYLVDGYISLETLNEKLHIKLQSENYHTLSGYMVEKLDTIPNEGEHPTFDADGVHFEVEVVDNKMITYAKLVILSEEKNTEKNTDAPKEKDNKKSDK